MGGSDSPMVDEVGCPPYPSGFASDSGWLCGLAMTVSQSVANCTFALPSAPPDADNVAVYVDKQMVPNDPANGWTYGTTTSSIVLTGSYCDHLKVAETTTVQVLFGCPGSMPPICIL